MTNVLGMLAALLVAAGPADVEVAPLATVAEASGFRATATHAEVVELLGRLEERSDRMHVVEIGRTNEGRSIPMAIIAEPPVGSPAAAQAGGKTIVLAFGNIHAGEVCGKEALLMLARELTEPGPAPLLDDAVLLVVPILNGDGNDRMAPDNRPGQVGPDEMGVRPNAQGLDLNRDWVKLEAPETRAIVRVLNDWDPHVTIDTHTTNGSHHRLTLTYAAPTNPSGFMPSIEFVRDELLPEVTTRLRERTGYDTFFYGNFNRDQTVWASYSASPRFGGPYRGLRGQMSILSEAHSYAPYEDRVKVTLEFVREIVRYANEHGARIRTLHAQARATTTEAGHTLRPDDVVGLRHRMAAFNRPVTIPGYRMEHVEGRRRPQPTEEERDYRVVHLGRFEPVVSVRRPWAYVIPARLAAVIELVRAHGIETSAFAGPVEAEAYTTRAITRADRPFQGHDLVRVDVDCETRTVEIPEGSVLVRTAQPLGTLAVYLLEPRSADGVTTWNLLDDHLEVGEDYPIYRVPTDPTDAEQAIGFFADLPF